ncbi:hypothetical protein STEG23_011698 [Scotinomys teguina]
MNLGLKMQGGEPASVLKVSESEGKLEGLATATPNKNSSSSCEGASSSSSSSSRGGSTKGYRFESGMEISRSSYVVLEMWSQSEPVCVAFFIQWACLRPFQYGERVTYVSYSKRSKSEFPLSEAQFGELLDGGTIFEAPTDSRNFENTVFWRQKVSCHGGDRREVKALDGDRGTSRVSVGLEEPEDFLIHSSWVCGTFVSFKVDRSAISLQNTRRPFLGDDEDVHSDSEGSKVLTPDVLAKKLAAAEGSEPKYRTREQDSSGEEDNDLSPEERDWVAEGQEAKERRGSQSGPQNGHPKSSALRGTQVVCDLDEDFIGIESKNAKLQDKRKRIECEHKDCNGECSIYSSEDRVHPLLLGFSHIIPVTASP